MFDVGTKVRFVKIIAAAGTPSGFSQSLLERTGTVVTLPASLNCALVRLDDFIVDRTDGYRTQVVWAYLDELEEVANVR